MVCPQCELLLTEQIRTPTTQSIILKMKDVFARWGVPETVVSFLAAFSHGFHIEFIAFYISRMFHASTAFVA